MTLLNLNAVKFDANGLVPVVVQDAQTGAVLMQAYADRAALEHTLASRQGTYYSRSRQAQWIKGETSGHVQHVESVDLDCDGDSILYRVHQHGPACHTGDYSCFHRPLLEAETSSESSDLDGTLERDADLDDTLARVYATIQTRLETLPENSYVARLHAGGIDRVLRKISEEAGEVLLAAKNNDAPELAGEAADLIFHLLFAMAEVGVTPGEVAAVLNGREGKTGLKPPKAAG
jgi:phosphoribosyl-AMP cyclohydrolase / phosphoribosyl-ATP pyrophosphohydrolase